MRTLNDREKRTIRLASVAMGIYLILFFGVSGWKRLEASRTGYQQLLTEAERLKLALQKYETRTLMLEKLQKTYHLDPSKLSRASVMADVSAAIQKAAMTGGVALGPVRESTPRSGTKELATIQLEGMGQPKAILALLTKLETLGFPLIVDQVQLSANPTQPGMIKINLTIVILEYEQWKNQEAQNA